MSAASDARHALRIAILSGLANGLSHAGIAAFVSISPGAVRGHVRRMTDEYEVPGRTALITLAHYRGWLPITDAVPFPLPPHQSDLLGLLALGLTDTEIARRLHTSARTVRDQNAKLARRYQTVHRAHTVRAGFAHGHLPAAIYNAPTRPGDWLPSTRPPRHTPTPTSPAARNRDGRRTTHGEPTHV